MIVFSQFTLYSIRQAHEIVHSKNSINFINNKSYLAGKPQQLVKWNQLNTILVLQQIIVWQKNILVYFR